MGVLVGEHQTTSVRRRWDTRKRFERVRNILWRRYNIRGSFCWVHCSLRWSWDVILGHVRLARNLRSQNPGSFRTFSIGMQILLLLGDTLILPTLPWRGFCRSLATGRLGFHMARGRAVSRCDGHDLREWFRFVQQFYFH